MKKQFLSTLLAVCMVLALLPGTAKAAGDSFSVDYSGEIPAETGARKLTDTQLSKLAGKTPEAAAVSISTLADAYAW